MLMRYDGFLLLASYDNIFMNLCYHKHFGNLWNIFLVFLGFSQRVLHGTHTTCDTKLKFLLIYLEMEYLRNMAMGEEMAKMSAK